VSTNLYVGNLDYQITDKDLETLFEQAGTVKTVNVIKDQYSGQSRGFGFVEMSTQEEAQNAIDTLNGKTFQGRTLVVNEAKPKRQDKNDRNGNQKSHRNWNVKF